jgi:F-type H+-transporting ATPase subunit epsilon
VSLSVKLVVPEGEIWAGAADRVVAKTLDGDVGILGSHTPLLGILSPGSVVRILPEGAASGGWIEAAVDSGFLSVAADRVSILARSAVLGADVDKPTIRAELESVVAEARVSASSEPSSAGYLRAQLRAAGDES